MDLSVNVSYFSKNISIEDAARLCYNVGFRLVDYTPPLKDDNWKAKAFETMDVFEKIGIKVHQSHAPFNRYKTYDNHKLLVERSLEAAELMNSKYLVIHGDEFDFENMEYTPEKALEYNYEYFAPIVEKGAKCGVNIAVENLFEDCGKPRFCSKTEEILELINRFHSDNVSCCWDFGHAAVSYGKDQVEAMRAMGKYLTCTHIHDNYFNGDMHLLPFFGKTDWSTYMKCLREIKYDNVLSLELVYGEFPPALAGDVADLSYKTVQTLATL